MASADATTTIVKFDNLIAADGAHSPTYAKIKENEDSPKQEPNSQMQTPPQSKQEQTTKPSAPDPRKTPKNMQHLEKKYHLGAYVTLKRKDGQPIDLPKREFLSSFLKDKITKKHHLYFLRFDKKSHQKSKLQSVKLGFIGEISQKKLDEMKGKNVQIKEEREKLNNKENNDKDKNTINENIKKLQNEHDQIALTHVKEAAADYLKCNVDDLEVEVKKSKNDVKNKLKILSFQGGSKKADQAAFVNDKGIGFYLAGDAYFTPNYPVGHGLNDGLEAAKLLAEIPADIGRLDAKNQHAHQYNELTSANAKYATNMMQAIRWIRKLGKIKYAMANLLEYGVEKVNKEGKMKIDDQNTHSVLHNRIKDAFTYSASWFKLSNPIYHLDKKPGDRSMYKILGNKKIELLTKNDMAQLMQKKDENQTSQDSQNNTIIQVNPTDDQLLEYIKDQIPAFKKFLSNIPAIIKKDVYRQELLGKVDSIIDKLREFRENNKYESKEKIDQIADIIKQLNEIKTEYHLSAPSDQLTKQAAVAKKSTFRFNLPFFSKKNETKANTDPITTPEVKSTPKNN